MLDSLLSSIPTNTILTLSSPSFTYIPSATWRILCNVVEGMVESVSSRIPALGPWKRSGRIDDFHTGRDARSLQLLPTTTASKTAVAVVSIAGSAIQGHSTCVHTVVSHATPLFIAGPVAL